MGLSLRTNRLRTAIKLLLLTKCDQVFYRKAKGTEGTHVVFLLDEFRADETVNEISLEVRVIGRGGNTEGAEDLSDDIWELLDHYYYTADDIQFTTYQNTRAVVEEDDSVIYRRLVFEVRAL